MRYMPFNISVRRILACAILTVAANSASAANCTTFASSLVFGNYVASSAVNVTGSITVTCPNGRAYNVALNAGLSSGATITTRAMSGSGTNKLGYALYSDAARTINWGNTSGTNWVTGTGTGSAQTITIYGRVPANEFVGLGSYTDTITGSVSGTGIKTVTAQFSVTATEQPSCTLSASNLTFGTYSGVLVTSTSSITVQCTNSTTYNIGLNAGTATGATVTTRNMTGPSASHLQYGLYRNSAHTTNWGNTVGTDTQSGSGSGTVQTLTVYGQLPAGQSTHTGTYSDTITATLTY
ncbi:MAG: spore coat U domain-containing protein [Acidobacteriota bacterium]